MKTTTDVAEAIDLMVERGGYEANDLAPFVNWLGRGDDVLVFSNHDLGSLADRPLYIAMPWERGAELPRQAPDGPVHGLGWRYLPELLVTAEATDAEA